MSTPYCFLRVRVRTPNGAEQDYVVDGEVTVKTFASIVLGTQRSGSIQILEIATIPNGVTPIQPNTPIF